MLQEKQTKQTKTEKKNKNKQKASKQPTNQQTNKNNTEIWMPRELLCLGEIIRPRFVDHWDADTGRQHDSAPQWQHPYLIKPDPFHPLRNLRLKRQQGRWHSPRQHRQKQAGSIRGAQGRKMHQMQQSLAGHLLWPDMLHRREQGKIIMGLFACRWVMR